MYVSDRSLVTVTRVPCVIFLTQAVAFFPLTNKSKRKSIALYPHV